MYFSPRIHLRELAQLCRRLAVATKAGLEDRRIWRDEAQRGRPVRRRVLGKVSDALSRGESIGDAVAKTGEFFPPLFRQIVQVGDSTGQLDRSYGQLAQHYEDMVTARRSFVSSLTWPITQLVMAVVIVGLTIWIVSALQLKDMDGKPLDLFGLGITGSNALMLYCSFLVVSTLKVFVSFYAARKGFRWTKGLQRLTLRLPMIGGALKTLALARFTWALQLLLDTPMDLRKSLPLALDAAGNDYYSQQAPKVVDSIQRGETLHQALASTGAFPQELVDTMEIGEKTGMIAETMERLSAEYRERARAAISVLAQLLGYLVWAAVAALIIVLIFRVANMYVGTIQKLSGPNPLGVLLFQRLFL
jgi:type II secretory pathway component PulF